MSQIQAKPQENLSDLNDDEINLVDVLILLAKNKKRLVGLPLAAALISAAIVLILPNIYKANADLLPPQQSQSSTAALLSQLGGMSGMAAGVAGIKNPNDLYIGMLKSRTVADSMISRFNLKQVYDTRSQEQTRKALEANTKISSGKDGIISIEVEDQDPKLAAKVANGYVDELLRLTKTLAVTEASQRRLFFERQLEQSKDNLAAVEAKLKGAIDTQGVISVDTESRALLETTARLKAQVSAKEIQFNSMKAFLTESHPDYKRMEQDLNSLRAELYKLENGRVRDAGADHSTSSSVGLENIKLLRDVKYNQMLYELLAKQYEAARLDEAKDPSVIQILDPAVEPEEKFKPKRALIVILFALGAFVLAVFWALVSDLGKKALSGPKGKTQLAELKNHLKFQR